MNRHFSSDNMDAYPDLVSCFRGQTNRRQLEEYRAFLYRAIKTELTQRQRQVLSMYFFEGMTFEEIARHLHINKSSACRVLHRALDRLADLAELYFSCNQR